MKVRAVPRMLATTADEIYSLSPCQESEHGTAFLTLEAVGLKLWRQIKVGGRLKKRHIDICP